MTSPNRTEVAHHGLAELSEDLFLGSTAVRIQVHGESMLMSDEEFRDVLRCARSLFPSMFMWPLPPPPAPPSEFVMCGQCGHKVAQIPAEDPKFCGDECEANWRGSEYRGWYPR